MSPSLMTVTSVGAGGGGVALEDEWGPALRRVTLTQQAWGVKSYSPFGRAHEGGVKDMGTRRLLDKKIGRIRELQDGWRGAGSVAPSRVAMDFYLHAFDRLWGSDLRAAEPTPTADGGLHMEWRREGFEYSAEVSREGSLILNVFAPDEDDDVEKVIAQPLPSALVDFIQQGVHGLGR